MFAPPRMNLIAPLSTCRRVIIRGSAYLMIDKESVETSAYIGGVVEE